MTGHSKGVYAIDWSPRYKFIVSCGMDRNVLLWNPFSVKSVGQLQGHTTSVVDLLVNEPDNQIITLGLDKCIKAGGSLITSTRPTLNLLLLLLLLRASV